MNVYIHDNIGFCKENIQPKFFYLNPDELWKWKVNVLNFMHNNYEENYKENYKEYIISACQDENERVSEMAQYICSKLYG